MAIKTKSGDWVELVEDRFSGGIALLACEHTDVVGVSGSQSKEIVRQGRSVSIDLDLGDAVTLEAELRKWILKRGGRLLGCNEPTRVMPWAEIERTIVTPTPAVLPPDELVKRKIAPPQSQCTYKKSDNENMPPYGTRDGLLEW